MTEQSLQVGTYLPPILRFDHVPLPPPHCPDRPRPPATTTFRRFVIHPTSWTSFPSQRSTIYPCQQSRHSVINVRDCPSPPTTASARAASFPIELYFKSRPQTNSTAPPPPGRSRPPEATARVFSCVIRAVHTWLHIREDQSSLLFGGSIVPPWARVIRRSLHPACKVCSQG